MQPLYMLRGLINGNNERFIAIGRSGNPMLQTKTGYRADDILLFDSKEQAEKFRDTFAADRGRDDIVWDIVEYKPGRSGNTGAAIVGMIKGWPGEINTDYAGDVYYYKLKKLSSVINGTYVEYYTRGNYTTRRPLI